MKLEIRHCDITIKFSNILRDSISEFGCFPDRNFDCNFQRFRNKSAVICYFLQTRILILILARKVADFSKYSVAGKQTLHSRKNRKTLDNVEDNGQFFDPTTDGAGVAAVFFFGKQIIYQIKYPILFQIVFMTMVLMFLHIIKVNQNQDSLHFHMFSGLNSRRLFLSKILSYIDYVLSRIVYVQI